ncbi:uncharacterized protein LOC135348083 isoform X2 [Halichondria panicea]|uniref:uncharacterized protein LOC135348083 isoform X2 n=1 Tax=Halichondria panicea TaxID=6063 RepID=UPI00312B7E5E
MTSVNILEIVAILLLLINHSNTLLCKEKATPSVGDLCLEQNKTLQGDVPLLLVYYTDSLDQPPKWGTICDDQVDGTALTTMCQQLGYDDTKYRYIWGYNDVDPWFSEVTCGSQTTQNILRCPFIRANNPNCSKIYLHWI